MTGPDPRLEAVEKAWLRQTFKRRLETFRTILDALLPWIVRILAGLEVIVALYFVMFCLAHLLGR